MLLFKIAQTRIQRIEGAKRYGASGFELLTAQIWSFDELSALDPLVRERWCGEHGEAWSALTIPAGTTNVIIYNPVHSGARRAAI